MASVLAKRAVSIAAISRPATGIRKSEACQRERNAARRLATANAATATTMPASQYQPVARKKPLIAISACVSHGSVCRLCW